MTRGAAISLLFAGLLAQRPAQAHDPEHCPPLPAIAAALSEGKLPSALSVCVARKSEAERAAGLAPAWSWLAWEDRLANAGPWPEMPAEAQAMLPTTTSAERALVAAERLTAHDPKAAKEAHTRAISLLGAERWSMGRVAQEERLILLDARLTPEGAPARRAGGLSALGLLGERLREARAACSGCTDVSLAPFPEPSPPQPGASPPDLGRWWFQALFGGVYETDRDLLLGYVAQLSGEARQTAGHLTLLMTLRHRERGADGPVAHRLLRWLPEDRAIGARVDALRAAAGEPPWRPEPSAR